MFSQLACLIEALTPMWLISFDRLNVSLAGAWKNTKPSFCPKFNDDFERSLTNDDSFQLRRGEPFRLPLMRWPRTVRSILMRLRGMRMLDFMVQRLKLL
ncbi:hypothetical protein [Variovorax boronicumulans]|uniref:hypothetical protein n=1 Tax=Variovorax boronicumulans TaxID=436515 RepID=UPI0027D7BACA|nr:hypothetical protein [Variovorax boronicumulans]